MSQTPQELAEALLQAATRAGADAADAIATKGTSLSIEVRDGALEQAERAEGIDIGLRVFVGQRSAHVSASDTRPDTLTEMAERAVAMAREAPEDPFAGLAEPEALARNPDVTPLEMADPTSEPAPAALQEAALRAEAAAQSVKGVSQMESASAGYGARDIHLAATNGFSAGYRRTDAAISCVAISGSGTEMERDYDADSRIFQADLRSPEEIGARAGARAVERSGARKPPTGSFPILYDERI